MANIKSAKKRVIVNELARARNNAFKSDLRNTMKGFYAKAEENEVEKAKELFVSATSKLDKAVGKGLLHRNAADRRKARLQKRMNELSA
ncbi:30S ribosomal protein S20 [Alkalicoccus halolimnae]|uniref:Small ribosomal subunit protein bS20 n=1 Tax=Alkalicoccus halolimnae TaxID=1667239 RepID=A0A5C7FM34_9BACI|nr:30S ribosomal protein S20 [Alkalicoccus halolimnae]TXF86456.1 30S ribosomal protein S20 [Alkalicoccus halolimnae]